MGDNCHHDSHHHHHHHRCHHCHQGHYHHCHLHIEKYNCRRDERCCADRARVRKYSLDVDDYGDYDSNHDDDDSYDCNHVDDKNIDIRKTETGSSW